MSMRTRRLASSKETASVSYSGPAVETAATPATVTTTVNATAAIYFRCNFLLLLVLLVLSPPNHGGMQVLDQFQPGGTTLTSKAAVCTRSAKRTCTQTRYRPGFGNAYGKETVPGSVPEWG